MALDHGGFGAVGEAIEILEHKELIGCSVVVYLDDRCLCLP